MNAPAESRGDGGGRCEAEQCELFEQHLTARYPSPNTQAAHALRDLLTGKPLRQSERLGRGWRLAGEIKELDYLGWPVISKLVQVEGRSRPIAEYSLPRWILQEVGAAHG